MLHVSEKPALSDTDYTDYMLNYSGLTQDNNLYFDETGNYKKKILWFAEHYTEKSS